MISLAYINLIILTSNIPKTITDKENKHKSVSITISCFLFFSICLFAKGLISSKSLVYFGILCLVIILL